MFQIVEREYFFDVGALKSEKISMRTFTGPLQAILLPTDFQGTMLSFEAAPSLGSQSTTAPADALFSSVLDARGATLTVTVAAGTWVVFFPDVLRGLPWIRLVAGTPQTSRRSVIITSAKY